MCLGKDFVSDVLRFCGENIEVSEFETVLAIQAILSVAKPPKNEGGGVLQRIPILLDT